MYYFKNLNHSQVCVARYLVVYSSQPNKWKLYPFILMSPPTARSLGLMNSKFLSTFLYLFLFKNGPSMIPEFFCAGSKIDIVSSARQYDIINLLSTSSGTFVLNLAVYLNIFLSLSTYLKKSILGFFGTKSYT